MDERLHSISDILMGARRAASALPGFPGALPETFADAYEIQLSSKNVWPDVVAGWKVGGVPAAFIEHFDATRLAGPIFEKSVVHAVEGEVARMPVFDGGFAAIEPEFIIELGSTRAEDRMYIGAEIASSPIPAINDVGPIAVICDFGNNNGLLLGPEIKDWQAIAPEPIEIETYIDGELIGSRVLENIQTDARKASAFLFEHADKHGITLGQGSYISTGAITGVHEAPIGARSTLSFGAFGKLELVLTKAEPVS